MDITVVSGPTVLGKVRTVGDIQEALLVFVDDSLGLRGNKAFQDYLRHSISYTLGIDISEIRIGGIPEHLRLDGIQFVVSDAVLNLLRERKDGVRLFSDVVEDAIDGFILQRDHPPI
jgi:hypothetical protein